MSTVRIRIDGTTYDVSEGASVAAALINAGVWRFRESRSGAPRGPVCGMGTCYECRVTIDGVRQQRACMRVVGPGMVVETGAAE